MKAAAEAAQKALDKDPKNSHLQDGVEQITNAVEIFDERKKNREANGRKSHTLSISPSEPEAMVQQAKRGRGYAASYKPSVLANEQRVVVAIAVDPSNENIVIPKMLDRAMSLTSQKTKQLLLDAGIALTTLLMTRWSAISAYCVLKERNQVNQKIQRCLQKAAFVMMLRKMYISVLLESNSFLSPRRRIVKKPKDRVDMQRPVPGLLIENKAHNK